MSELETESPELVETPIQSYRRQTDSSNQGRHHYVTCGITSSTACHHVINIDRQQCDIRTINNTAKQTGTGRGSDFKCRRYYN